MSAVWFYPNDNWPIGPTQRLGIYRDRTTQRRPNSIERSSPSEEEN
ncbi:LANO_0H02432g1_1 [Lachancea nothofagi CBS 11611]|uniref:LANO_0H02432g1_1 n=1 Tax=Lachancea nothofagi CBS 11611 TaxID=1266666 RepID=A0A1G4KL40_9SACH|nr:LANO_0H02432g1_1 [Lachancea nothofagi CBS 11611]